MQTLLEPRSSQRVGFICSFSSFWPFLPALSPILPLLYSAILTLVLLNVQRSGSVKHQDNISDCNRCYLNKAELN